MSQINKLKGNTNGGKLMTYMNFTTGHEVTSARPTAENSGYLTVFGAAKLH